MSSSKTKPVDDKLACLMELALSRPSKERHIILNEIAQKAGIEPNNVELLVMKAFSKGLVRGSIDQVEGIVSITWVQPRALSLSQIAAMADRVGDWRRDVENIEGLASESFIQGLRSVTTTNV